jgi:hypothetical protein
MPEPILWNLVCILYHGNWAHLNDLLHKYFPSVSVSVCVFLLSLQGNGSVKCVPPFGSRQRLKHFSATANTRNNRRIVGRVVSCVIRVLFKESVGLSVYPPVVPKNSVKTLPRQRRIVGGVVSMRINVVSKESRQLLLPRTYVSFGFRVTSLYHNSLRRTMTSHNIHWSAWRYRECTDVSLDGAGRLRSSEAMKVCRNQWEL